MSFWQKLCYLLPSVRRSRERDMKEELASLREIAGPGELGNLTLAAENARSVWVWPWLESLGQDLVYALRQWRKSPRFTAIGVASLALAIGSMTAVEVTGDWLLDRSPGGVVDPDRIILLRTKDAARPDLVQGFSFPQFEEISRFQELFVDVAAYTKTLMVSTTPNRASETVVEYVTGNYFSMLGLQPGLGRLFNSEDIPAGAPPAALLSHDFWIREFLGDPSTIGQEVRLNGTPAWIVGVLPKEFDGYGLDIPSPTDIWLPMQQMGTARLTGPSVSFRIIGRLSTQQSVDIVRERVQTWLEWLPPPGTPIMGFPTSIEVYAGDQGRLERPMSAEGFFLMLEVVTVLILLAACFNIGNLLLSKAVQRRAEMATRVALGATRTRLIRQLLLESALISAVGCGLGIVLSIALTNILAAMTPVYMDPSPFGERLTTEAAVDFRIVGVALVLATAAAGIFGLVPAFLVSRADPGKGFRRGRPQWTRQGAGLTVRQTVLVGQVAFSVVLAASAGLYVHSFIRAASVESEYANQDDILLARVAPPPMARDRYVTFYESLLRDLDADTRVISATTGSFTPYFTSTIPTRLPDEEDAEFIPNRSVAPRWFETHGVRLLAGREFDGSPFDIDNALIINQPLADHLWPDGEGLNRIVNSGTQDRVVIGVVDMERCDSLLGEPMPCSWRPFAFVGSSWLRIRTSGPPEEFAAPLREMVRSLEPEVAVSRETRLSTWIAALTARQRSAATLSAGLAGLAVLLMVVGTISLFLSMVKENARETAIRQALGASPTRLMLSVVGRGAGLLMFGVLAGLAGVYAVSNHIADQLYRTTPDDPLILAAVAVLILLPALLALYGCARRSIRTDPASVLQAE